MRCRVHSVRSVVKFQDISFPDIGDVLTAGRQVGTDGSVAGRPEGTALYVRVCTGMVVAKTR
jgi:hypothetical protein